MTKTLCTLYSTLSCGEASRMISEFVLKLVAKANVVQGPDGEGTV